MKTVITLTEKEICQAIAAQYKVPEKSVHVRGYEEEHGYGMNTWMDVIVEATITKES